MMNKKRTKSIGKTKYAMFIPLAALLMLVSNIEVVARVTGQFTKNIAGSTKDEVSKETALYSSAPITLANDSTRPKKDDVYTAVEVMPQFPGGEKALLKYIASNLKYPVQSQENKVEGKVYIRFIVTEKGNITKVAVMRSLDQYCNEEALRVIKEMPKWTPGKQNGKNVSVYYVIPIKFKLTGSSTNSEKNTPKKKFHAVIDHGTNLNSSNSTSHTTINKSGDATPPLYILNGKEISGTEMKKLDPNNIQSINVLKDKSATEKYGDKGANGVIEITLKEQ